MRQVLDCLKGCCWDRMGEVHQGGGRRFSRYCVVLYVEVLVAPTAWLQSCKHGVQLESVCERHGMWMLLVVAPAGRQ